MKGKTITLIDRSEMRNKLKGALEINPIQTAILAVDMHRGHLDPKVATMPVKNEDAFRVINKSKALLKIARKKRMKVIHVILQMRSPGEVLANPFWATVEKIKERLTPEKESTIKHHNLIGTKQTEIIPDLFSQSDIVISNKKRLSSFYGTDLEIVLRVHKINTLIIIGVNTNTCVMNAAFDSHNRDFKTIVISDCVASMYGDDLHMFALENIGRCFGWVLTLDEFKNVLG